MIWNIPGFNCLLSVNKIMMHRYLPVEVLIHCNYSENNKGKSEKDEKKD